MKRKITLIILLISLSLGGFAQAVLEGLGEAFDPTLWWDPSTPTVNVPSTMVIYAGDIDPLSDFDAAWSHGTDAYVLPDYTDRGHIALTEDPSPDDLSAEVKFLWDDYYLYYLLKVTDDVVDHTIDDINFFFAPYNQSWDSIYDNTVSTEANNVKMMAWATWSRVGAWRAIKDAQDDPNASYVGIDYSPAFVGEDLLEIVKADYYEGWIEPVTYTAPLNNIIDSYTSTANGYNLVMAVPYNDFDASTGNHLMRYFTPEGGAKHSVGIQIYDKDVSVEEEEIILWTQDPSPFSSFIDQEGGFDNLFWANYMFQVPCITLEYQAKSTGIRNADVIKAKVYPNPASSSIAIKGIEFISSVSILNVVGKEVKTVINASNKIDVSDLIPGVYFLHLETEEGKIAFAKFIKN